MKLFGNGHTISVLVSFYNFTELLSNLFFKKKSEKTILILKVFDVCLNFSFFNSLLVCLD